MWPSHRILWHLMNLTMFSLLIMASKSSFRQILHNSFSFTGNSRNHFVLIIATCTVTSLWNFKGISDEFSKYVLKFISKELNKLEEIIVVQSKTRNSCNIKISLAPLKTDCYPLFLVTIAPSDPRVYCAILSLL
jgi:hypothetical protein